MPDNTPPANGTPAPEPAPKPAANRRAQDKAIEAYISNSQKFLTTASTDEDIRPILEAHGYDAAEFKIGIDLAKVAADAYAERAGGLGKRTGATEELNAKLTTARDTYASFREIARAVFPDQASRQALTLTGDVPDDTGRFITTATASYTGASGADFTAKLTKRNYAPARLTTLIADLNLLLEKGSDQDGAEGDAIDSTAERNDAYTNLKTYMKEIKGIARGSLRGHNGLLTKLGL